MERSTQGSGLVGTGWPPTLLHGGGQFVGREELSGFLREHTCGDSRLHVAGSRRRWGIVPPIEADLLCDNVEQLECLPDLGRLVLAKGTGATEADCHVIDLAVGARPDTKDFDQPDIVRRVRLENDPLVTAEDLDRVPAGEHLRKRVLARWGLAERNDISKNVGLPLVGEVFERLDEYIREDDLRLVIREAFAAPHLRRRAAARD
ncbi:MAG: hypothetical protein ACYC1D_05640 [Acidimicrobiales bacterium]